VGKGLSNVIAVVVTVVWTASFLADIFMEEYDPSPFVHLAMMAVVGAAFGTSMFKKSQR
jgi:uncharacterized membrane protein